MQMPIIMKLQNNQKASDYLSKNSRWYKELNRDSDNYQKMIVEMNQRKRIDQTNKINNTIDNLELVSNIINILK